MTYHVISKEKIFELIIIPVIRGVWGFESILSLDGIFLSLLLLLLLEDILKKCPCLLDQGAIVKLDSE